MCTHPIDKVICLSPYGTDQCSQHGQKWYYIPWNVRCTLGCLCNLAPLLRSKLQQDGFLQWNHSNTDILGSLKCVLIEEVSSFRGVNNTFLYEVGTWSSVLIRDVSSFQGCPLRGVPLYLVDQKRMHPTVAFVPLWLTLIHWRDEGHDLYCQLIGVMLIENASYLQVASLSLLMPATAPCSPTWAVWHLHADLHGAEVGGALTSIRISTVRRMIILPSLQT